MQQPALASTAAAPAAEGEAQHTVIGRDLSTEAVSRLSDSHRKQLSLLKREVMIHFDNLLLFFSLFFVII